MDTCPWRSAFYFDLKSIYQVDLEDYFCNEDSLKKMHRKNLHTHTKPRCCPLREYVSLSIITIMLGINLESSLKKFDAGIHLYQLSTGVILLEWDLLLVRSESTIWPSGDRSLNYCSAHGAEISTGSQQMAQALTSWATRSRQDGFKV